jgi:hypothetical protein
VTVLVERRMGQRGNEEDVVISLRRIAMPAAADGRGSRSPSLISLLILLINTTLIRCLAGNNSAVATRRLGGWWCVLPPARAVSECVRATQNKCAFRPVSIRQTLPNGPCGRNKNSGHRVIADRQTTLFVRSGSHQRLC